MKRQRKFALAAVVLVGIVGYLMVTGMKDSMTYYFTPDELAAKLVSDPTAAQLGVRMGGRVVPGTVRHDPRTLDLRFDIVEIDMKTGEMGKTRFPVHYNGPLPDTFEEGRDVVVTGSYAPGQTFQATELLTKCGSRYEAAEEDFKS